MAQNEIIYINKATAAGLPLIAIRIIFGYTFALAAFNSRALLLRGCRSNIHGAATVIQHYMENSVMRC